ncbi:MAG TPA: hypothetical protein VKV39_17075 [Candidatus Sulfotelmatobacter sp.]|nr:hypothetical protein [Candidatus Sulfotelmatobacter sp.]
MKKTMMLGHDVQRREIRLSAEDRRVHTLISGSSGSGKSKMMEWMMQADLRNRQGFCLIDPHGDLYDDIVGYCAHRVLEGREIIQIDLSQPGAIIGFNPFQSSPGADVSVLVDRRVNATMHAWNVADSDQTPTLARTLRLIYTVMLEHNLGLPQVRHLIDFHAAKIRAHLINQLKTPLIQKEWQELQSLSAKDWRQETLSARNRLFKFLTSQTLSRVMGVPGRSINLTEVMDQGKVLLVKLAPSDHLSSENARAFGALLVNEFFECALRRAKNASGERQPYYLYMDEFQSFVSRDISGMLDQVRKFGLYVVLAHQRFSQLDQDVVEAALTNCAVKAVFGGLSVPDARRMAEEMFIGDLDPTRIKVAIRQTKFWPQYSRDKVYSKGSSRTSTEGVTHQSAHGSFSSAGSGEMFQPGDWFGPRHSTGFSASTSRGNNSMSGDATSTAHTSGETESVADIPILLPVPFRELSSLQFYTPEEQLLALTAALKEQFQRHCFIKLKDQRTQPMLVPFVANSHTPTANRRWYVDRQASRQNALPAAAVDELIAEQERQLLGRITESDEVASDTADGLGQQQTGKRRAPASKQSRRRAAASPLDEAWRDVVGRD